MSIWGSIFGSSRASKDVRVSSAFPKDGEWLTFERYGPSNASDWETLLMSRTSKNERYEIEYNPLACFNNAETECTFFIGKWSIPSAAGLTTYIAGIVSDDDLSGASVVVSRKERDQNIIEQKDVWFDVAVRSGSVNTQREPRLTSRGLWLSDENTGCFARVRGHALSNNYKTAPHYVNQINNALVVLRGIPDEKLPLRQR